MSAQREVWGRTIAALAEGDDRIVVLDGDLATSTRADIIAEKRPDQFIQVGIAEQNMVGVAMGMTTLGFRPWLSSFGVFFTSRALDQIRMLVSQTHAPVRLAASYTGLLNGASGKTHQDIEDLAVMRALPNFTVIAPADAHEAESATRWAAGHDGPVYLRLARDAVDSVFGPGHQFRPGLPQVVRDGGDLVLVSTGVQTSRTAQAVDALAEEGWSLRLIHLPTLKPIDEDRLLHLLAGYRRVVTVEEHSVLGGLGGLVAEILTTAGSHVQLTRLGLADRWSESGPNEFLLDKYGLSPRRVAERLRDLLGEPASAR